MSLLGRVVKLKNGAEVPAFLVYEAEESLRTLRATNYMAFFVLVKKCRGEHKSPFGVQYNPLKDAGMLDKEGQIHEPIKNVILSAVEGGEENMVVGSATTEE